MHDAARMRRRDAARNLQRVGNRPPLRHRAGLDSGAQGLAVDELGHDVGNGVLLTEFEDRENVGVRQLCDAEGFLLEPRARIR